jgi:cysteine desulfurase
VDEEGRVDPVRFAALLDDAVVLVSLMAANNETGVLQPLAELAACVERLAPAALFHTDAVQAFSCLDPTSFAEADLVSFSAHKFGGPKGIGALVVRARARPLLRALLEGGAQEHELRAGTENVPGIIGMAAAARVVAAARDWDRVKVAALRDRLAAGLAATVPGVRESGRSVERIASICHVVFPNVAAEELLLLLDEAGIAASAGAACASGALEPSHVLLAMGRSAEEAKRAVRFSLGPETSVADIDRTVIAVGEAVGRLTAVHDAGEN